MVGFVIGLLTALGTPAVADTIYKWRDANGVVHFGDAPPDNENFEQFEGVSSTQANLPPLATDPATQAASETDSAADGAEGMLWKIERDGMPSSYLFGTIHSSDPRVTRLSLNVSQALATSDTVLLEIIPDASALMKAGTEMFLSNNQSLEAILGSRLFADVTAALSAYGIPGQMVNRLQPWAVFMILSVPRPTLEPVLDTTLYLQALEQGKQVIGLETAAEQLSVFGDLSLQDQVRLVEAALRQFPNLDEMVSAMVSYYLAGDLQALADYALAQMSTTDAALSERLIVRLNDERNVRMLDRMQPYLRQGRTFVAVGALHLANASGLIRLLTDKGYRLSALAPKAP
jgi:uncharacterized protein YbaP (TraB family)